MNGSDITLRRPAPPSVTDDLLSHVAATIADRFHPVKIILFGSRVWGTAGEWSDVDLLVVMDFQGSAAGAAAAISVAARPPGIPMDILVRRPAEIDERINLGDHFIKRIFGNGRVLYERLPGS